MSLLVSAPGDSPCNSSFLGSLTQLKLTLTLVLTCDPTPRVPDAAHPVGLHLPRGVTLTLTLTQTLTQTLTLTLAPLTQS